MKTAVVLFVKNEVEDICWWISWHLSIGFSDIIIYDDDSSDGTWELINSIKNICNITCLKAIESTWFNDRQRLTYLDALSRFRDEFDWIIFLDADEYVSVPDNDLEKFLSDYPEADSISLNWKCFGSNGNVFKPHSPNVFENYLRYSNKDFEYNYIVKSFIRPSRTHVEYINPHRFNVFGRSVTANHKELEWQILHPERTATLADWDIAYINHFMVRSTEHYIEKIRRRSDIRGSGMGITLFNYCDRNDNLNADFQVNMYKKIYDGIYDIQNYLARLIIKASRCREANFFTIQPSLIKTLTKTMELIEVYEIESSHRTFLMREEETGQIVHKKDNTVEDTVFLFKTPFLPEIGFMASPGSTGKLFLNSEARVSTVLSYVVEDKDDDMVSFKSPINNKYVSARNDDKKDVVKCNVEISDEWEQYKLHRLDKNSVDETWMIKVLLILSKMKNKAYTRKISDNRVVDGIASYLQIIDMHAAFEPGVLEILFDFPWLPKQKYLSF